MAWLSAGSTAVSWASDVYATLIAPIQYGPNAWPSPCEKSVEGNNSAAGKPRLNKRFGTFLTHTSDFVF